MASKTAVIVPKRAQRAALTALCFIALQALLVLASCQAELAGPVPAFAPIRR